MTLVRENEFANDAKVHVLSFYSFIFTSIFLIVAGLLVKIFVNDSLDVCLITSNFNLPLSNFVAERSEKIQYHLLTLLMPVAYICIYKLLAKFNAFKKFDTKLVFISVLELTLAFIIGFVLNFIDPKRYFFSIHSPVFITAIFSVLFGYFTYLYKIASNRVQIGLNVLLVLLLVCFLGMVFWLYFVPSYGFDLVNLHHFEAYYAPIYKVYSGLTIGKDFNCLYGLYPYIYEPILKLIGGVSILKISLINTVLIMVSILSVALTLWFYIKNRVLWFLSVIAFVYISYVLPLVVTNGYYLQFHPHRTIFLCLVMALSALYLNLKPIKYKKICVCFGYVLSFISIIWNFETGFIVNLVWLAFLSYLELCKYNLTTKKLYMNILKLIAYSFLAVSAAFLVIYFISYFRIGEFLPLSTYFSSQMLFYGSGYYMIKMKLFEQPWILLILVYMLGLVKSLNRLKFMNNKKDIYSDIRRSALYFVVSLIGFGLFVYYQGRSHISVLGAVSFPMFILLGLFMQEYLDKLFIFKNASKVYLAKFISLFLVFCFFSCTAFQLFFSGNFINNLVKQRQSLKENSMVKKEVSVLKQFVKNNQNIDLITNFASIYYTELGQKDLLPFPAVSDWITKGDYSKVISWLNKTNNIVVLDVPTFGLLMKYSKNEVLAVIQKRFKAISNDGLYIVLEPQ